MALCACGREIVSTGRGRPRKKCLECAPRKRALTDREPIPCAQCGRLFTPDHGNATLCSDSCRKARRMKPNGAACRDCGRIMYRGPGSLPEGEARCNVCRRADPDYRVKDMRARGIVEMWTCARCGVDCSRLATKGQRPSLCARCRDSNWVTKAERRRIYERDAWVCWLCEEPVDGQLIGSRDIWRPSLDHVIPRSHGGADDASNLRLAHYWCNIARGAERYTPEDFRVCA